MMAERNEVKPRVCRVCGGTYQTTAAQIIVHADQCAAQAARKEVK